MRFQRNQHLRTQADFESIRASGFRRECGVFLIQILEKPIENHLPLRRVGVIASRRVGNAIARNRCKRRLREVFRLNQSLLPESCDLVLIARRRLLRVNFLEIEEAFHKTLQKYSSSRNPSQ